MRNLIVTEALTASTPPSDVALAMTPGTELTAMSTAIPPVGWRVILQSQPIQATTLIPAPSENTPGVPVETLIAQIVNGLLTLQKGPTKSRANALAITKLEEAVHWLKARHDEEEGGNG